VYSIITKLLGGVACIAAVSAAGSAVVSAGGAVAAPTPATATAEAAAYTVPHCTNADLHARYAYSDSGAGSVYGWIRLRNVSDHACVTGGYGGLSYVGDGNGTQIGHAAIRIQKWAVESYVVQPGQRLVSPIQLVRAGNYPRATCRPAHVDGFRVYVPNAFRSQFVPHRTTGCRNTDVHLIYQKPYRRG
jgi:hypothetical protein